MPLSTDWQHYNADLIDLLQDPFDGSLQPITRLCYIYNQDPCLTPESVHVL